MSGSSIPYHLRPHKAVDRRLFLDLLSRYERWLPLLGHVYISMGAFPLEDHKQAYRILGLTKLVAFDMEDHIVSRQRFNRPTEACHCLRYSSGEFIDQLNQILEERGFGTSRIIFWLDYTRPSELGEQIREFEALLGKLREGDIVRVTVNAEPEALSSSRRTRRGRLSTLELQKERLKRLRQRISEYLPSDTTPDHMTEDLLPVVIASAFGKAASKAFPPQSPTTFAPLSIVRYADGQQMLSITGAVTEKARLNEMTSKMGLAYWPLASTQWDAVHQLLVPSLTIRERLFLERCILSAAPPDIIAELGFDQAGEIPMDRFLESYRDYYRFYPTLLAAEV